MRRGHGHWFWLSFADPSKPKGEQWLGGCYIDADALPKDLDVPRTPNPKDQKFADAVQVAHILGINPGGEVYGVPIPGEKIPEDHPIGVLITTELAKKLGFVGFHDGKEMV